MSKKVLIIKPSVHIEWKEGHKFCEDITRNIEAFGVVVLPYCFDYEFGEVDGVKWEDKASRDNKPSLDYDCIIDVIDSTNFIADVTDPESLAYVKGANDALHKVLQKIKKLSDKEKTNG